MVVEEKFEGEESYKCEAKQRLVASRSMLSSLKKDAECGFHYETMKMAEKCEEHCRDYDACDTEIVENSLERKM